MKLKRIETSYGKIKLVIEEEVWYSSQGLSEIWARLDIYEEDTHVNDYLLQSIEEAKVQALLQLGISVDDWVELESVEETL